MSVSGSMITGALLPSSRLTRLRASAWRICHPTSADPVNVTMATSGWVARCDAVDPLQVTTLSQPGGRPHSSVSTAASRRAVSGVDDAGLSTTGHPAAMAGATLWATRLSGKLNGVMAATTPMGSRRVNPSLWPPALLASSGTISPVAVRATAAANRNVSMARATSMRAVVMGLADSALMSWANSSA